MTRPQTLECRFVNVSIGVNGMTITLNEEGKTELAYMREQHGNEWNDDDYFFHLIDDMLGNGWTALRPEQIGALTSSSIILAEDVGMDEEGEVTEVDDVFWHERYQIELAIERLEQAGLFLLKAPAETPA